MLSPVVKQRCDTLLRLFNRCNNNDLTVIVSGCGHYEVDSLTGYLLKNGIPEHTITKDYNGINTGGTINYLRQNNINTVIFISQSFHLHRTLEMARDHGIAGLGLAAEKIAPTNENISIINKYYIRIRRYYKSSFLLLLHKINCYSLLAGLKK